MPPKLTLKGPYGPGSPLLAPEGKKTVAGTKTTTAPVAVAASAAAAAVAAVAAPAKKTRHNRRRRGKKGSTASSSKKTTAKSPSSSASTVASAYNYRSNADMPDKAEVLADLLDLINMHEEAGDEEEAASLLKIYYGFVKSMSELDKLHKAKVKE